MPPTRLLPMQALCINDAVLQLGSPSLINERCLDLQKPGSSSSSKKAAVAAVPGGGGGAAGPRARKVGGWLLGGWVAQLGGRFVPGACAVLLWNTR